MGSVIMGDRQWDGDKSQEANRDYFNSGTRGPWQEVETGNADSQNDTFKLIFFLKSITNVDQYRFTLNEHVQAR